MIALIVDGCSQHTMKEQETQKHIVSLYLSNAVLALEASMCISIIPRMLEVLASLPGVKDDDEIRTALKEGEDKMSDRAKSLKEMARKIEDIIIDIDPSLKERMGR